MTATADRTEHPTRIAVLADQSAGGTLPLLGLAARLAGDMGDCEVVAVVAGQGPDLGIGLEGLGGHGADRVLRFGAARPGVAADAAAAMSQALDGEGERYALVPGTLFGLEAGATLAARARAGIVTEVVGACVRSGELVCERMALGDAVRAEVRFTQGRGVMIVRRGSLPAATARSGSSAEVLDLELAGAADGDSIEVLPEPVAAGEPALLEDAEVVVAGGHGLGGPAGFVACERLAGELGAAVAASRAAVDAGWYPYASQVGQTGRIIEPRLYIAVGISGASQHLVGMERARWVIAINPDRAAPIQRNCDLGVAGDAAELLPALTERLRRYRAERPAREI